MTYPLQIRIFSLFTGVVGNLKRTSCIEMNVSLFHGTYCVDLMSIMSSRSSYETLDKRFKFVQNSLLEKTWRELTQS